MKIIRFIAALLVIIGAINWGLWGIFQFDIVKVIFPYKGTNISTIASIAYIIIGLAGLYGISFLFSRCCSKDKK